MKWIVLIFVMAFAFMSVSLMGMNKYEDDNDIEKNKMRITPNESQNSIPE